MSAGVVAYRWQVRTLDADVSECVAMLLFLHVEGQESELLRVSLEACTKAEISSLLFAILTMSCAVAFNLYRVLSVICLRFTIRPLGTARVRRRRRPSSFATDILDDVTDVAVFDVQLAKWMVEPDSGVPSLKRARMRMH